MGSKNRLLVRFSNTQVIPDDIHPPPLLRKHITELAEDNMDSNSKTICNICKVHFSKGSVFPFDVRKKVIELSKENGDSLSKTVCKICKYYFDKFPVNKRTELK